MPEAAPEVVAKNDLLRDVEGETAHGFAVGGGGKLWRTPGAGGVLAVGFAGAGEPAGERGELDEVGDDAGAAAGDGAVVVGEVHLQVVGVLEVLEAGG